MKNFELSKVFGQAKELFTNFFNRGKNAGHAIDQGRDLVESHVDIGNRLGDISEKLSKMGKGINWNHGVQEGGSLRRTMSADNDAYRVEFASTREEDPSLEEVQGHPVVHKTDQSRFHFDLQSKSINLVGACLPEKIRSFDISDVSITPDYISIMLDVDETANNFVEYIQQDEKIVSVRLQTMRDLATSPMAKYTYDEKTRTFKSEGEIRPDSLFVNAINEVKPDGTVVVKIGNKLIPLSIVDPKELLNAADLIADKIVERGPSSIDHLSMLEPDGNVRPIMKNGQEVF